MWKEFKAFLMRGNVLDLAVGIVIGAAFGKIVASLVADVLMPPIGLLLGRVDFSNLFIDLSGQGFNSLAAAKQAGVATLNYGVFLNHILEFLIIGFAVFIVVKAVSRLRRQETAAEGPAPLSQSDQTLLEIRDLIRESLAKDGNRPLVAKSTDPTLHA